MNNSMNGNTTEVVLKKLSTTEIAELQEIFNLVDEDRSGSISQDELQRLMSTVGIHTTQHEISRIVEEIDENNDGEIQFEEFVAVMSRKVAASYTTQEVVEAFKLFANDSPPGYISSQQLEYAITHFGSNKQSLEKAAKLISKIGFDKNGLFNYEQHAEHMMHHE